MEEYPDDMEFDAETQAADIKPKRLTKFERIVNTYLLSGLIGLGVSITILIIRLWPSAEKTCCSYLYFLGCRISEDQRLFILVALGGALGAFIHSATSFTDFVGNRKLVYSWVPWYIMRPFIGSSLAIVFYIVIRGGLVSFETGTAVPNINPFGIMTVACLSGLFSKQAIDKLREIFENIFQLKKEVERKDGLQDEGKTPPPPADESSDETAKG